MIVSKIYIIISVGAQTTAHTVASGTFSQGIGTMCGSAHFPHTFFIEKHLNINTVTCIYIYT